MTFEENYDVVCVITAIFDFVVEHGNSQGIAAEGDGLRLLSFEEFSEVRVFSLLFSWEEQLENEEEQSLSHALNAEDDLLVRR